MVDSIWAVTKQDEPTDFFMAEVKEMKHRSETNTSCIRGPVLEQRAWQSDVKKKEKIHNPLMYDVSYEYEKNKQILFVYKSAEDRK